MSISLLLRPGVRVGGETIRGEVELHFPQVQEDEIEEVHVKLRGSVNAKVARQVGNQYVEYLEKIEVVHENISVWTRASAYPAPATNILKLPFQFRLPIDCYPSAHYQGWYKAGMVGYSVEAVGVRKGFLHANRRAVHAFPALPGDLEGMQNRALLRGGWVGPWKSIERTKQIRRGLWGAYSSVRVEMKIPEIKTLPLFTNIPVIIHITTTTKPMKRDESSEGEDSKGRIFPCPPQEPKEIELFLRRRIRLSARGWDDEGKENISSLGGLGKVGGAKEGQIEFHVGETRWNPSDSDKGKGCWVQESTVNTSIHLTTTPSFMTHVMSIEYMLRIKIEFPGIKNDVEIDVPVRLTSAMVPPPDTWTSEGSSHCQVAPPYEGGSPILDLPPSYWTASEWDADEKGGKIKS